MKNGLLEDSICKNLHHGQWPVATYLTQTELLLYKGITIPSVWYSTGVSHNNNTFVGNIDTFAGLMDSREIALKDIMQHLTKVQHTDIVATSIVFHKYVLDLLLGFVNICSSLMIEYGFKYNMLLSDSKGACTTIKYTQWGYWIPPSADVSQIHKFSFWMDKTRHMCKALVTIRLCQFEAKTMLNNRLVTLPVEFVFSNS